MSLHQDRNSLDRTSSYCDENKKDFDWDNYIDSFWTIISAASNFGECEEEVNFLLENLLKFDCEDFVLCSRLIDFIAAYRNSKKLENRKEAVVRGLIAGDRAREKGINHYMQINARNFILALRRSDAKLLRLFLKYGINVLDADQETEKREIMRTLKRFYYYALGVERVLDDMVLSREEVLSASELIAETFYRMITKGLESEDHTRLMQILFGVEALLRKRKGDGTHQEYADCIRIYFRDLSWPFISLNEIRYILDKFGCDKPLFVENLCQDFIELFPEFPRTPHTPRSLKALCRAEVRDILLDGKEQSKTTLPVAVSALYIPITLKDYLLGEEW